MVEAHKILLLEDDKKYARTIKKILCQEGLEVVLVFTKKEAISIIDETFHLALLDICLDELDRKNREGLDVLKHIRERNFTFPILIHSVLNSPDTLMRAINEQADGWIPKEEPIESVIARIKRILNVPEFEKTYSQLLKYEKKLGRIVEIESFIETISGTVHILKNRLFGIANFMDLIKNDLKLPPKQLTDDIETKLLPIGTEILDSATDYVSRLLDRLRYLMEGEAATTETFLLKPILEILKDSLEYEFNNLNIDLDLAIPSGISLHAQKHDIEMGFLNIILNAKDAIVEKREKLNKIPYDYPGKIRISAAREQNFVSVVIEDNGVGIDSKACKDLFVMPCSTKPAGKGTGLGLYWTNKVLQRYNGTITYDKDRSPKNGAKFIICLQAVKGDAREQD